MTKEEAKEWTESMAKQLRVMLRHIANARGRSSAWVAELDPGNEGKRDKAGDEGEKDEGEAKQSKKHKQAAKAVANDTQIKADSGGQGQRAGEEMADEGEEEEPLEKDDEVPIMDKSTTSSSCAFLYGYDAEHKQAWRMAEKNDVPGVCRQVDHP